MAKSNRNEGVEDRRKRRDLRKKENGHGQHEEVMKELIEESNKRRIIVRKADGDVLFETPLTVTIVVFFIGLFFFFPVLILVSIAAYMMKVRMDIVRDVTDEEVAYLQELEDQQTLYEDDLYEENDGYQTLRQ